MVVLKAWLLTFGLGVSLLTLDLAAHRYSVRQVLADRANRRSIMLAFFWFAVIATATALWVMFCLKRYAR